MLEHWTEHEVMVNGARFYYQRGPATDRPTLLLVHGFSDNGMCWVRAARELEPSYDILLPDLRGHGRSERVQPGGSIDNAADLAGFIDALGLGQVLAGGHSMGASAVAELGALYPDRVRGLMLEDPPWFDAAPTRPAPTANPFWDWLKTLPGAPLEAIIAHGRAENSPLWHEDEWIPWAESKRDMDLQVIEAIRTRRPWREIVPALRSPTLLVTGDVEKNAIVSPSVASEAASLNPLVQVAAIPGAGHSIRRENFTDYMAAVSAFLKSVA